MRIPIVSALLCLSLAFTPARAFWGHAELTLDATSLAQLEMQAERADPREQCFLYTELVHVYTELAGKQMAAGDMDQASLSLKRIQKYADHIHLGLAKDTKRLKNAEMLMHTASHHLGQYLHLVSSDDKAVVELTLKQLNRVNDELLAQVFAH